MAAVADMREDGGGWGGGARHARCEPIVGAPCVLAQRQQGVSVREEQLHPYPVVIYIWLLYCI